MARLCGACCGLVVFSAMVLSGIAAGHSAQHVLLRAVTGMFAALILGNVVGWVGMVLVRDNVSPSPAPVDEPESVGAGAVPPARRAS